MLSIRNPSDPGDAILWSCPSKVEAMVGTHTATSVPASTTPGGPCAGPALFVLDCVERALLDAGDGATVALATETLAWLAPSCIDHPDPMVACATLRLLALELALADRLAEGAVAAARAVDRCRDDGLDVELGRALLVAAAIERRLRRRSTAEAMCLEAAACFAAAGLPEWQLRASRELGRLGLQRGDGFALTPTERSVAELAASGATNREIARRLNLGIKTVEVHLTRAFRKLGIRRRGQLARALGPAEGTG